MNSGFPPPYDSVLSVHCCHHWLHCVQGPPYSCCSISVGLCPMREVSVGQIAAFIGLIAALVPYMRSLGWLLSVWQRGKKTSLERIYELLDAPLERPELEPLQRDICISNPMLLTHRRESYWHQGKVLILTSIIYLLPIQMIHRTTFSRIYRCKLHLVASTVGIFGQTGSGKSSSF